MLYQTIRELLEHSRTSTGSWTGSASPLVRALAELGRGPEDPASRRRHGRRRPFRSNAPDAAPRRLPGARPGDRTTRSCNRPCSISTRSTISPSISRATGRRPRTSSRRPTSGPCDSPTGSSREPICAPGCFRSLRNTFLTFYRLRERESAISEDGVAEGEAPMFQDAPGARQREVGGAHGPRAGVHEASRRIQDAAPACRGRRAARSKMSRASWTAPSAR